MEKELKHENLKSVTGGCKPPEYLTWQRELADRGFDFKSFDAELEGRGIPKTIDHGSWMGYNPEYITALGQKYKEVLGKI